MEQGGNLFSVPFFYKVALNDLNIILFFFLKIGDRPQKILDLFPLGVSRQTQGLPLQDIVAPFRYFVITSISFLSLYLKTKNQKLSSFQ